MAQENRQTPKVKTDSEHQGVPVETDEQRRARIAEAAYRKAAQRGFAPGGELDDWLAAEREVAEDKPGRDIL
jgi:hypothetical protein